jgi:CubicO group peptidase (beta-lactamase class C family)
MRRYLSRRAVIAGSLALGALSRPFAATARPNTPAALQAVLDYVRDRKTTGFLVIQDGKTLVEENWGAPSADLLFRSFSYETSAAGALLEDVASQQKSFVSMLVAIAIDKGLLDISRPVADFIGQGWSKATREQEAGIRVMDVLAMSSGLTTDFTYQAPPGTVFLYNTPVYATTKQVLAAAVKLPLESITRDWLTAPAGMSSTSWRKRPFDFAEVGNPTGLVTSPRDTAKFGQIVLDRGRAADGKRIVSAAQLNAMFSPSATNPAYGRLWWLNGSAYTIKPLATRIVGPLIPAAPADLVAALGALDRKLYIVPSKKLLVVRMGATAGDKDFDQQLWVRLMQALG